MTGPSESERAGPQGRPSSKGYRVLVDRDLCQGHGVCENEAPNVFELAKKATTITVLDDTPPESERAAVEAAVKYCPTHALAVQWLEDRDSEPVDQASSARKTTSQGTERLCEEDDAAMRRLASGSPDPAAAGPLNTEELDE